jgi:hypothetical protein
MLLDDHRVITVGVRQDTLRVIALHLYDLSLKQRELLRYL